MSARLYRANAAVHHKMKPLWRNERIWFLCRAVLPTVGSLFILLLINVTWLRIAEPYLWRTAATQSSGWVWGADGRQIYMYVRWKRFGVDSWSIRNIDESSSVSSIKTSDLIIAPEWVKLPDGTGDAMWLTTTGFGQPVILYCWELRPRGGSPLANHGRQLIFGVWPSPKPNSERRRLRDRLEVEALPRWSIPYFINWNGLAVYTTISAFMCGAHFLIVVLRVERRTKNGKCWKCAYPRPVNSDVCPECGTATVTSRDGMAHHDSLP